MNSPGSSQFDGRQLHQPYQTTTSDLELNEHNNNYQQYTLLTQIPTYQKQSKIFSPKVQPSSNLQNENLLYSSLISKPQDLLMNIEQESHISLNQLIPESRLSFDYQQSPSIQNLQQSLLHEESKIGSQMQSQQSFIFEQSYSDNYMPVSELKNNMQRIPPVQNSNNLQLQIAPSENYDDYLNNSGNNYIDKSTPSGDLKSMRYDFLNAQEKLHSPQSNHSHRLNLQYQQQFMISNTGTEKPQQATKTEQTMLKQRTTTKSPPKKKEIFKVIRNQNFKGKELEANMEALPIIKDDDTLAHQATHMSTLHSNHGDIGLVMVTSHGGQALTFDMHSSALNDHEHTLYNFPQHKALQRQMSQLNQPNYIHHQNYGNSQGQWLRQMPYVPQDIHQKMMSEQYSTSLQRALVGIRKEQYRKQKSHLFRQKRKQMRLKLLMESGNKNMSSLVPFSSHTSTSVNLASINLLSSLSKQSFKNKNRSAAAKKRVRGSNGKFQGGSTSFIMPDQESQDNQCKQIYNQTSETMEGQQEALQFNTPVHIQAAVAPQVFKEMVIPSNSQMNQVPQLI